METLYKKNELIPHYVERRALKGASAILTIGKLNLDIMKEKGFKNIFMLYLGTMLIKDIPRFEQIKEKIISVTMRDYGRHPETFIEIAKIIEGIKIYLVGDWADKAFYLNFIQLIKSVGMEGITIVTGRISRTELEQHYKTAKVMIRFGYNEAGPGMGTLEAISYGFPLIINKQIGIKEIIESITPNPFYVIDENDLKSIANAIKLLISEENVWESKSRETLSVAHMLSWENHGKTLEEILKNIIGAD